MVHADFLPVLCFEQGSAIVWKRSSDDSPAMEVGKLGPSDYFGELTTIMTCHYTE